MAGGVRRSSVVVGRQADLDRLRRAVADASAGVPAAIFLTGEAGIGKTRLLGEVILEARRRGFVTLVGRAGLGTAISFGLIADALRSWLRGRPEAMAAPSVYDRGLQLILPEWPAQGAAPGLTDSQLRLLAHEGVVNLLRRSAGGRGVLIAADDLHAADPESLEALRYAVAAGVDGALLVATARVGERPLADQLIQSLAQQGLAERWPVEALSERDVDDLMAALLGTRPPPEFVREVLTRTDGVPLLVEEILDAHLRAGSLTVDARGAHWRGGVNVVPRNVAALVATRLDRLSDAEREVIEAGSVVGLTDAELLAAVSARTAAVVRSAIAHAVDAGLVETVGGLVDFRHAVIGDAVREHALPHVIQAAHTRAATALARTGTRDPSMLERRAAHLAAIGNADEAARVLVEASTAELTRHAPLRAESLAREALDLASLTAAADALAAALTAQGRWTDALAIDERSVASHGQTRDRWIRMVRCALDGRLLDTARRLAEAATKLPDPSPFVDVAVGRIALFDGDSATALDRADHVLAGQPDEVSVRCAALDLRGRALDFLGRRDEAAHAWTRQAEVAADAGLTGEQLRGVVSLAELELLEGRPPRRMYEAVELARDSGALVEQAWAELNLSIALTLQGDPRAGARVAAEAVQLCRQYRLDLLPFAMTAQLGAASCVDDGGFDELFAEIQRLAGDAADVVVHTYSIAGDRALRLGRLDEAIECLGKVTATLLAEPGSVPSDSPYWLPMVLRAVGRDRDAAEALALARSLPDVNRWHGRRVVLAAAEAIVAGDGRAVDAAITSATGRMPMDLALIRVLAAETIGGPSRARWLRAALDSYEACGITVGVDRVRALLREAGGSVPRRRRTVLVPPELIPFGVTAREAEVLTLVCEGLSNAAIADRLYVSVRTVESHVSSLLSKLSVASRQQLARAGLAGSLPRKT